MQVREPLALQALRYTATTAIALAVLAIVLAFQHRSNAWSPPRVVVEPNPGYPVRLVKVTKTEIIYQNHLVSTVESALRVDSPTFFVDGLREAVEKDAAATFQPGQWIDLEKLQLSRMVLVQLDDQTDPQLERKILYTLSISGWQPIVHYMYDLH